MKLHWAIMLSNRAEKRHLTNGPAVKKLWSSFTKCSFTTNSSLHCRLYSAAEFCGHAASVSKSIFESEGVRNNLRRGFNLSLSFFQTTHYFAFFYFIEGWIDSHELNMKSGGFGNFFGQKSVLIWYRWYILHLLECRLLQVVWIFSNDRNSLHWPFFVPNEIVHVEFF